MTTLFWTALGLWAGSLLYHILNVAVLNQRRVGMEHELAVLRAQLLVHREVIGRASLVQQAILDQLGYTVCAASTPTGTKVSLVQYPCAPSPSSS